ncbi:hypothetical protein [Nocardioides mangrovi]|uniref:Peptidase C39 domain-containing protein n=1 Tax=Nocardioides mangrovi TaxID=2874580 RepID=A0ABS7UK01_9ACTN|nr:hypothetical protein [Nocardioides mangrovi]MBZ5741356.1 hypothetical protein [Nocardioides mangrovi]
MTAWPRQPDNRTCGPSCVVVAETLPDLPDPRPDFTQQVLAMHRRLNTVWPRALGTTPWAVRRELGGRVRRYHEAEVLAALPRPVPVYLGSRWVPRHVVLVLEERDGVPWAYNPATGHLAPLASSSWRHRWFAVLPA